MARNTDLKPAEAAEKLILDGIQSGQYAQGTNLPPERELALSLQVTRPTLREVLQRLARDGWLEIQHGKPTRVLNYLLQGKLSVLSTLAERLDAIPSDMVSQVLQIRVLLAPAYTRMAISNTAPEVEIFLQGIAEGSEDPAILAFQDFQAQKLLSRLSGNAIMALALNNLETLYIKAMSAYYKDFEARKQARVYFRMVYKAARAGEPDAAEAITRRVMQECVQLWENADTTGE